MMTFVGATSAQAASVTGSASAIRAGAVGTIPSAKLSIAKSISVPTSLTVVTAPSSSARVYLNNTAGSTPATSDDSATLLAADSSLSVATFSNASGDDSTLGVAVDTAGSYTLRLANGTDTATVSFTTAGAPASISLAPATQTVLVGATANMALSIKDASGNATQAAIGDTIALSRSGDDTLSTSSISAAEAYLGSAPFTVTTQTAGTETITATPQGTLPSTGVTAATATVTASGSVSSTAVANVVVTSPATVINTPAATTASASRTAQVPANSASIGIKIDDTTANAAGTQIRVGFVLNSAAVAAGASINGQAVTSTDDTVYVNLTTGADKSATTTVALGGAAVNTGAVLSMNQYTVTDSVVGGTSLVVSQLSPAVYGDDVTFSPVGPLVGQLGTAIPVTVTVDDSFGTPQSGWTVQAWRSSIQLSSATTNASGQATVSVVNATGAATGTAESYEFRAIPPIGSTVTAASNLSVTWTTTGGITSLSVAVSPGSTPIEDPAGTAPTTGPLLTVPYDGTANTVSTATYNLSTGAAGGTANGGEVATLIPTASPVNDVTVTAPLGSTGVYVSDTPSTAWNAGKTSVTVASGTTVYVFATKVGEHTISLTSGGKTVAVKVKAQTSSNAAYNMELSPATQEVNTGSINTATLTVTDVFGNAVQTTDDTGKVTITASGNVLLAGYNTSASFNTNASGQATVTVIAGNAAGAGALAATPASSNTAAAWLSGYTKPTAAPDPKSSAAAEVIVGTPETKSIVIVGDRTTVSGKSGIIVEGSVTGIEDGKTVVPYIRFPGQTTFTAGSARPEISGGGFTWQRKTGKRVTVYVTNDDGAVKSNRVTIQAN
jgi:hypothetical protein